MAVGSSHPVVIVCLDSFVETRIAREIPVTSKARELESQDNDPNSFEIDGYFDSMLSREQLCYSVAVMGDRHGFNRSFQTRVAGANGPCRRRWFDKRPHQF